MPRDRASLDDPATCGVCGEVCTLATIWSHLREAHDVDLDDAATWPDGELVVVDHTLEPEDFR